MEQELINYSLDLENFKRVPFQKYQPNFTIFFNGNPYPINRYIADILSPTISNLHFVDESINEFYINTSNNKIPIDEFESKVNDYFKDFLSQALSTTKLDTKQQIYYSNFFYNLGNIDEYVRLQKEFFSKLTIENSIDLLFHLNDFEKATHQTFKSNIEPIQRIISYVSKNFEFINKEKMKKLDFDVIEEIISNSSLKLKDEDSLIKFILSLYEIDESYSNLFEYVQFNNLSNEMFTTFIKSIEFSSINPNIWNLIRPRILSEKQSVNFTNEDIARYFIDIKEFTCNKGDELNGIMKYLEKKTNGNINDNKTIKITSNSIHNSSRHPKNLVDFSSSNVYQSKDDGDAIICFDFKSMFVQLSSYSILSCNSNDNGAHLKNWVIEVSNDGKLWTEVDRNENSAVLRGPYKCVNFNVLQQTKDFFRFIRLRQTGESWWYMGEHNYLTLCSIDFYGKLKYSIDYTQ